VRGSALATRGSEGRFLFPKQTWFTEDFNAAVASTSAPKQIRFNARFSISQTKFWGNCIETTSQHR
jgi:hypothetical protein